MFDFTVNFRSIDLEQFLDRAIAPGEIVCSLAFGGNMNKTKWFNVMALVSVVLYWIFYPVFMYLYSPGVKCNLGNNTWIITDPVGKAFALYALLLLMGMLFVAIGFLGRILSFPVYLACLWSFGKHEKIQKMRWKKTKFIFGAILFSLLFCAIKFGGGENNEMDFFSVILMVTGLGFGYWLIGWGFGWFTLSPIVYVYRRISIIQPWRW